MQVLYASQAYRPLDVINRVEPCKSNGALAHVRTTRTPCINQASLSDEVVLPSAPSEMEREWQEFGQALLTVWLPESNTPRWHNFSLLAVNIGGIAAIKWPHTVD